MSQPFTIKYLTGLLILFTLLACLPGQSQSIRGKVTNESGEPLPKSSLHWLGSQTIFLTDRSGLFSLTLPPKNNPFLIISHAGYVSDSISVNDTSFLSVKLKNNTTLNGVIIQSKKKSSYIASNPIKTEVITSAELKKTACCDLAGCFETQSTVQPQTTNIITNSKELRILGLSGIYNQILIDGFPLIQGLSYTYGISNISGTMIDNIFVAKGANSVLQGFESISGQINVMTKNPAAADKFYFNVYGNSFAEKQFNAHYSLKKKKWNHLLALYSVQPANRIDKDDDGFLDLPLITRYTATYKTTFGEENKPGFSFSSGLRYVDENRLGGQKQFNQNTDKGSVTVYGQTVSIRQPEGWTKSTFAFNDNAKLVLHLSGLYQDQLAYFGITRYAAIQKNMYANLQFEWGYGEQNTLLSGISYRDMTLGENISFVDNTLNRTFDGEYEKKEKIPGAFVENKLVTNDERLTLITGIRADNHNQFGWQVTPRFLIKYDPTENITVRASAGKGWRTANIFSENIGLMASSRNILFTETLLPEKATNIGVNATYDFAGENINGYISFDYYLTRFQNQIFPDFEANPTTAIIKNFRGKSISNGFQAEMRMNAFEVITLKCGYVFLDVFQYRNEKKYILPFNSRNRIHASASFNPKNKKWHADANFHWYGTQGLPDTKSNPLEYQRAEKSEPFSLTSIQFTRSWKKIEAYAGVENLFDFRQNRPIISWQDPFGKYFDTQFAWGPTRGIEIYAGLRLYIK